jgi:hypothetical protein
MHLRFGLWSCVMSLGLAALGCSGSDDSGPSTTQAPDPGPDTQGCGLNTGWAGDELCIPPPPEGQGFQVHYGPSDYADEAEVAKYLIEPGVDTNIFEAKTAGNTKDVYFYKREYRMRRGSHHLIVSAGGVGSILGTGRRLGGSQNVIKDNPTGEMPPENVGIGMPLSALSPLTLNLHHFNSTPEPLLREAWINFWYVDASTVTQEAREMFLWAQGTTIAPGARATVRGKKVIDTDGRVLTMYGHRHSNNVRFSVYRVRGDNRELVYDDYDWEEPAVFEFNSLTENPAPNPAAKTTGAYTGILDLKVGDALEWECEIVNNHAEPITFGENEAATSEMCILVGDAIGPALTGFALP